MEKLIQNNTDINDEAKLLQSFLAGNKDAFSLIYKKYVNELFAYGMGLGVDRETLKDAIQDVFYKFHENKKQLAAVNNLKYYLLRILKNRLLNIYRAEMKISDESPVELSFTIKSTVLDDLIQEEEQLAIQTKVDNLLKVLTDRQREAIYLRFIQEMEYEEIGKLLEMTPQASRKLVSRAIKRMREEQLPLLLILITLEYLGK